MEKGRMTGREERVRQCLLQWYRHRARDLPWRRTSDPYRIWVSEIMLQQTTVTTATPYWERFMGRFPTVEALAAASVDDVLAAWSGLGYYRRARLLHRAAIEVSERGGQLPVTAGEWRRLPGVGEYTAAAIASIAHGDPVPAIDGNVARVLARVERIPDDPARQPGRRRIRDAAERFLDPDAPGELNQALMELGARVCRPRSPECGSCPIAQSCRAGREGDPERFPRTAARRPSVPVLRGAFRLRNGAGETLLARIPPDQPNAGLWELPTVTVHHGERDSGRAPPALAGGALARRAADALAEDTGLRLRPGEPLGRVRHAITHHRITVYLFGGEIEGPEPGGEGWKWVAANELEKLALTSAGRRLLELGPEADTLR
jgi:A/G-specific adenine glycosylase